MADAKAAHDLKKGVLLDLLPDGGTFAGKVDDEEVVLVRQGKNIFAIGAYCTHYHGPLAEGIAADGTVRCPWHHARFDLKTGEAVGAPALDPIGCWRVERVGDSIFVREKVYQPAVRTPKTKPALASVFIVGGGAAGLAAADMLRREGFEGTLTMLSADDSPPCDRPNLSKDYLAGTAQEDWIPLRSPEYYKEKRIDLVLGTRVSALDVREKRVQLEGGKARSYGALLLATGAEPVQLQIPGAETSRIHYLRTFADSRAIVDKAGSAKRAVVVGASFIGLEVAASLRTRGLEVHVVAPEKQPLERVMGTEIGAFIREIHQSHGVIFHLGQTVARMEGKRVALSDGSNIDADFLVLGVGVRPAIALAERAGLMIDRGVTVNKYLETSASGVFAAGDIARWPDPHSGERIRVEHWVVAERQGQAAARNILGRRQAFDEVPFFWSQHYDLAINYVGHAERWDAVRIDGSLDGRDCAVRYRRGQTTLAVATIGRDRESLKEELAMEKA
jgi:NADPH-dependent 2,4-dienoyl-CoA reductase/sulfur reductase-like enzyme